MDSISTQDLNLRPHAMQAIVDLIRESGEEKIEQLMKALKEEKHKIEVFKRELPLTMQILHDLMDGFTKEVERRQEERLKELPPVQLGSVENFVVKSEKDHLSEKSNWLSSAQLWVDNPSSSNTTSQDNFSQERGEKGTNSYQGKFMPFSSQWPFARGSNGERQEEGEPRVNKLTIGLPNFANMPPPMKIVGPNGQVSAYKGADGFDPVSPVTVSTGGNLGLQVTAQQQRKARRCWSPDLHREFVAALNRLGGPQVATPKQIRELMKVDGLTNDEVKSHLQKYRLHNRRVPNAISTTSGPRPMGLMDALLGTSSEHGATSSQKSISQSASPKDMHQFTASGRTTSTNAGDSCEEEDVISESFNWK